LFFPLYMIWVKAVGFCKNILRVKIANRLRLVSILRIPILLKKNLENIRRTYMYIVYPMGTPLINSIWFHNDFYLFLFLHSTFFVRSTTQSSYLYTIITQYNNELRLIYFFNQYIYIFLSVLFSDKQLTSTLSIVKCSVAANCNI